VLELLTDVVEGTVADPAGGALLARLLGEEPHRLAEQAQRRIGGRKHLDGSRADAAAPGTEAFARERDVERSRRQNPARGAAGDDRARLVDEPAGVVVDQLTEREV
jgi:hypothetical protein